MLNSILHVADSHLIETSDTAIDDDSNDDLCCIVTPINVKVYEQLLRSSNYDPAEIDFLVDGFSNGFDIGYEGPKFRTDSAHNIPFKVGNRIEMWCKIMKEVKAGRYAGPFDEILYAAYIQSPIGLVPKAGGQTRLIFHLSYNFKKSGLKSVNFYTPKEKCSIHYNDLDNAVAASINCRLQSQPVFCAKTDLKSAFRILPLKPSCFCWLVMKAYHPATGQLKFFVEKNLPFGSSISCSHFQRFSNSLRHIFEHQTGSWGSTVNYLDDYLFISPT